MNFQRFRRDANRFRSSRLVAVGLFTALLILSGCGGSDDKNEKLTPGSRIVTESQLRAESEALGYPIYWLGPREGVEYEFTEREDGRVYIRYVPTGTQAGTPDKYLTVGTYPMEDAYETVSAIAELPGAKSPPVKGGIAGASKTKPESVFVAFRGKDLQIEVFDPNASAALEAVSSGDLQPVK